MLTLPIPVLLVCTILTSWINSVLGGYYSKRIHGGRRTLWIYNFGRSVCCAGAIAILLAWSGGLKTWSLYSMLLGLLMGMADVWGLAANLKAFAVGPFSYTTVIISLSSVIPALSGLFWGETVTMVQWCGVLLMIVCLILSPEHQVGQEPEKQANAKWLLLCLIAAVSSGATGVLQKLHQNSVHSEETGALLLSCFAVSALMSAVMLARASRANCPPPNNSRPAVVWGIPCLAGCVFAFPHTINLFLSGKLDAVILFPMINLLPMLLAMVSGIFLFREKLSVRRWCGVGAGILAAVCISGIF